MPTMSCLSTGLLAARFAQALGRTYKPIGGGRQIAIMAIFGLLPLERFEALLQRVDQPLELCHALLLQANGDEGLFEPFAQVLPCCDCSSSLSLCCNASRKALFSARSCSSSSSFLILLL